MHIQSRKRLLASCSEKYGRKGYCFRLSSLIEGTMNKEINARMDYLLRDIIEENRLEETFTLKLKAISDLMKAETARIKRGGNPDDRARKTFVRILDKFSAQLLEFGVSANVCEEFNRIANDIRN